MSYNGISDFRSDTVTRPTPEMRKAMHDAEVGDDVHRDDPTVIRLEELAAEKVGKEAALFVPTGTMGNSIAMILGVGEGHEVILEENSHIMKYELGNISRLARSLPRALPSEKGKIPIRLLESNIHPDFSDHVPQTKAISLENTHNNWGGAVLDLDYLESVSNLARKYRLHMHLDGARVFNASAALNTDAKEITKHFDTLMFCLSKGLSAPVGSILAGTREFIREARFVRKYLGGGMRQVGVIAAPGIIAIEKMTDRLVEDHRRAKQLAEKISDIHQIGIDLEDVVTNFLMLRIKSMEVKIFLKKLADRGVLALPFGPGLVRIVTHKDIDDRDIERAAKAIREVVS
ncbi:MAG: aminotransferase class I/II-fold pyridoxal phosphate-dependent enzyme [bacterium]|nr:aminotransferase class I/II-fold pyridoxal phosphate-dependent enzyme [bacterium]